MLGVGPGLGTNQAALWHEAVIPAVHQPCKVGLRYGGAGATVRAGFAITVTPRIRVRARVRFITSFGSAS